MSGREEFAWDIFSIDNAAIPDDALRQDFPHEADYAFHITEGLIEAGYRKPRTITTAEELIMLEPGAVIQGPDFHEETFKCTAPGTFHAIAAPTEYRPSELVWRGPFTVLHEGSQP